MIYAVHNLVKIEIHDKLIDAIGSSLEFQIGYFKITDTSKYSTAQADIKIRPYDELLSKLHTFKDISEFHLSRGVSGKCLYNESKRLGIIKTNNGYDIYADAPNFLINLYIQLVIYNKGYSMVHAGGFARNNGITLIAGAGGVGKTALLGHMVKFKNYKILGDDIAIIKNDGTCLSFPRAFVFKEYHREVYPELFKELNIPKWSTYKLKRFIIENIPFTGLIKSFLKKVGKYYSVAANLGLDPYLATVAVDKIFGDNVVLDQGNIKNVIFLERYNGRDFICEHIDKQSMGKRLFAIIHHEWNAVLCELFELGSLEIINVSEYFYKVEQNINEFIQNCNLKILRIPNGASPNQLASYFEKIELS